MNGQLAKWVLLLQEFSFNIVVCLKKNYVNIDHVSILDSNDIFNLAHLHDELQNINLVEVVQLEYGNILKYLITNQIPSIYILQIKLNFYLKRMFFIP